MAIYDFCVFDKEISMKQKEIFKFALEQFVHNFFKQFCVGCLLIVSMLAFGAMFYMDYKTYGVRNDLNNVFKTDISDKGIIDIWDDESLECLDEIKKIDGLEYLAGYSTGGTHTKMAELVKEIQAKNKKNINNDVYIMQQGTDIVTTMMNGTLELFDLEFIKGGLMQENDRKENTFYVYLGSDYEDIEIGTSYYDEDWQGNVVVAGILKKGQYIMHEAVLSSPENISEAVYSTDCMVFMETKANYEPYIMFKVKDGYDVNKVSKEIKKHFDSKGYQNSVIPLAESLTKNEERFENMFGIIKELMFVLAVTIIVLQTCISISEFITRKRYYGILFSNGMTNKDLMRIVITQNIILFVICIVMAWTLGVVIFKGVNMYETYIFTYVSFKTALVTFFMLALAIVIPIIYINKQENVDLIYR